MKFFYDTEFLEDGRTIDLISIGIVAEDGREYYAVNAGANWDRIALDGWLMDNVVPLLPPRDSERWLPTKLIAAEVAAFLDPRNAAPSWADPSPQSVNLAELWAWFGAYDHVALAQLFGRMMDLPPWVPMWTNDVKQEHHRLGRPPLPRHPDALHDALADARHVRTLHDHLADYAQAHGRA